MIWRILRPLFAFDARVFIMYRRNNWVLNFAVLTQCSALFCITPGRGEDSRGDAGTGQASSVTEITRLIHQLGSKDFGQREAASKALEAIGAPALAPLRNAATDNDDAEIRRRAEGLVRAIEGGQYQELRRFKVRQRVLSVAWNRDGTLALSAGAELRVWELKAGTELHCFESPREKKHFVLAAALSPDGKRLLSGDVDDLRLWDLDTEKELACFKGHTDAVASVAFSPDGKLALSGSYDDTLRLWDVEVAKALRQLTGHTDTVNSIAFSRDGKRALSGSWDKTLRLWDVDNGTELRCFKGHKGGVGAVALSPDGKRALSGGGDKTVRLWDVETGKELHCFDGHTESVVSVAFSPDGKRALSGDEDTMRLWDLETGKELHCFEGHLHVVTSVAFSPDGTLALSATGDGRVRIWQLYLGPARLSDLATQGIGKEPPPMEKQDPNAANPKKRVPIEEDDPDAGKPKKQIPAQKDNIKPQPRKIPIPIDDDQDPPKKPGKPAEPRRCGMVR
jgi:WD40 repeat protein